MTVGGQELTRNSQREDESPTHVGVSCKGAAEALRCTVSQRGVKESLKACFDLTIACASGAPVSAHACAHATPQGSTPEQVPYTLFPGFDQCPQPAGVTLSKLTVTREG